MKGVEIDELDRRILEILENNGRLSFVEIARRVGTSEATVRKRIRRLEELGVIERYTIDVDHQKLGYDLVALVGIDAIPESIENVVKTLSEEKCVKKLYLTTGDHAIIAEIWAEDIDQFGRIIIDKLKEIRGILRVCPAIVLKKVK